MSDLQAREELRRRRRRRMQLLPFIPSLLFGLAGAAWVLVWPPEFERSSSALVIVLAGAATAALLLGCAWLLERFSPSFRLGSQLTERALRRLRISPLQAFVLATVTATGEELLFRGGLMQLLGVWGQALVFGALHPISRGAWAYTVYTAVAGVVFGYGTLLTGSLWTPLIAHFLVNLHGLLSVAGGKRG